MRAFSLTLLFVAACGSKTAPTPSTSSTDTMAPTAATTATVAATVEADATSAPAEDVAPTTAPEEVTAAPAGNPTEPIAVTGGCVKDLDAGNPLAHLAEVAGGVRFCRMNTEDRWDCWALDLASRTLAATETPAALNKPLDEAPLLTFPAGLKVEDEGKKASWCPPSTEGTCHALDLAGMKVGQADASGDRVLVAPAYDVGTEASALDARVFGADGKLVGTIALATADNPGCPEVRWAGSSIYVSLGVCAGPGATGWLADPATGKRRAWLGGGEQSIGAYAVMPVMVAPEVAAFREQYGDEVVFHDTTTGAVIRRTDLRVLRGKTEDGEIVSGSPEEGDMVAATPTGAGGKTLVVTNGDQLRKMVVTLDPETGAITSVLTLPSCPTE